MTLREEFEKAVEHKYKSSLFYVPYHFSVALWGARWMAKQCEEACMSPTAKGRIRELMREFEA